MTWPAVAHLPSPANPALSLHQEWWMRTGEYDDRAMVVGPGGISTTFAALVVSTGDLEQAVRSVALCLWLSPSEYPGQPDGTCRECLEVAHA